MLSQTGRHTHQENYGRGYGNRDAYLGLGLSVELIPHLLSAHGRPTGQRELYILGGMWETPATRGADGWR